MLNKVLANLANTQNVEEVSAHCDGPCGVYDPASADLYSDDAVIKIKRVYPNGQVKEMSVPAPQYKELLRKVMPLAKARGDRSTYSGCKYTEEGDRVRIACDRYSELKKYTSPVSFLVGPGPEGEWLFFEELSESRP